MAKKISNSLEFYYDEDIFNREYTYQLDPTSTVLLESGAMVEDGRIAEMIAGGGNYYTLPFYKDINGTELNYDGATDITGEDTASSDVFSGVVYGRAKRWAATDFVSDFSSADPAKAILNRLSKWKAKKTQVRVIGILEAVLGVTQGVETGNADATEFTTKHITNIASSTTTITDANKIALTTLRDAAVKAQGDKADDYAIAIMHSQVANRLSQFNVLEYFKYNDANGQERDVKVGKSGNMLVFVCDEVPHSVNQTSEAMEYTTYCLGKGVLGYAKAPVEHATEIARDPAKNGGTEYLYTRYRETIHPYGFSFGMQNLPVSPTDAQISTSANWTIKDYPKNIAIAKIVSNG